MPADRAAIARAWAEAQINRLALRTQADVRRHQDRLWRRYQPVLQRTPALAEFSGLPHDQIPVSTPTQVRQDFARWNTVGLSLDAAITAAEASEDGRQGDLPDGLEAGFSTGTSGARGLFIVSPRERAEYIGHTLAKLLPLHAPLRQWRIALCLRADSALYRDVAKAGSISFAFLGLELSTREKLARLEAFRPHVLIAPSHVLADLARHAGETSKWPLSRVFYGAEPMSEAERTWVGGRIGVRPDPIYQATEGFLGAPCRFGTLHLNEDFLIVEREPVSGTNRFRPIVTDLRRTSQPIVRIRLNDLLESAPPCRCISPLHAVLGVEGRFEDIWRYPHLTLPPRIIEDALAAALGPDVEWRITASLERILIEVDPALVPVAKATIAHLFAGRQAPLIELAAAPVYVDPKRRRVRWVEADIAGELSG